MPENGMYHLLQKLQMVTPCILNNYVESGDWIGMVQDRTQWVAFVKTIRKISLL
jgi:hypothetical protein